MPHSAGLAALLVPLLVASATVADAVCVLKLNVSSPQSRWSGGGRSTVPTPGLISSSNLSAVGNVYLQVPTTTCPPKDLAAADAQALLEKSSLLLPIGSKSLSFRPADIKSNITSGGSTFASFDFIGLELGLTGNEPLGAGAVVVGAGTAAEAEGAVQQLCSQLVMLAGELNLTTPLGPRTADVENVAYNRSTAVGVSIKKADPKLPAVLYISNASLFLNISPATGSEGTPGVEFTRATYLLSGDVVATADLATAANWEQIDAAAADWSAVARLDAPIVVNPEDDGPRAKGRVIGLNSTIKQECTPTRVLSASGNVTAAAPADSAVPGAAPAAGNAKSGAADRSSAGMLRALAAGAAGMALLAFTL